MRLSNLSSPAPVLKVLMADTLVSLIGRSAGSAVWGGGRAVVIWCLFESRLGAVVGLDVVGPYLVVVLSDAVL